MSNDGSNDFTLLVVDDGRDNLATLRALLEDRLPGVSVLTAGSAEEGMSAAEAIEVDGAIVDVEIPGTDGIEMCRLLKGNPATADVPVILMMGQSVDAELKATGLEAGADDFINKPVDASELLARIKVMLRVRRAQEALRRSEERFRQLFENMSSGVAVYEAADDGRDFIIKDFNKASERINNVARCDVIGRSVLEVFPGVRQFGLFAIFQKVYLTGRPEHFPVGLYRDERVTGWRENYVYKLPSGEVVAVYDDVTERKQAEQAVQAIVEGTAAATGEELFRSLVSHLAATLDVRYALIGELVGPFRVASRAVWADGDFGERLEYDLAGTPCEEVMASRSVALCPSGVQEKFPQDHMLVEMGVDSYLGAPLTDADGQAQGVLVVMDDKPMRDVPLAHHLVTIFAARAGAELSRLRAEEELRRSEARLRSIFSATPAGIGLVADRVVLEANDQLCQMLGYTRPELVGQDARMLYPTDEDYEYVGTEKYAQIRERGTGTVETRWRRKDGTVIDVLLSSTPLNSTNLAAGITFTALDITERKQAQQKLTTERAALEQKNIALREVMSSVQDEKKEASGRIVRNVEEIVMPILRSLQDSAPPALQEQVARAIGGLEEITSPFVDTLSQQYASLTPTEIRMCDSIRAGLSTKEIAKLYRISADTVNNHRRNIRRKLGLAKTGQNLVSYLQTLAPPASGE
ncbi:MAG: PAS domain S-box protein [Planctomycetota bacterium]|jgi:PAS domain S-box-containing protein